MKRARVKERKSNSPQARRMRRLWKPVQDAKAARTWLAIANDKTKPMYDRLLALHRADKLLHMNCMEKLRQLWLLKQMPCQGSVH